MSQTSKKILVIEDDSNIRESLKEFLEDEGYSVDVAENGLEGLGRLSQSIPNVILLDYTMPVMDGPTFLKELQSKTDVVNNVSVILLTAAGAKADAVKGVTVIKKPIDLDTLLAEVRNKG